MLINFDINFINKLYLSINLGAKSKFASTQWEINGKKLEGCVI